MATKVDLRGIEYRVYGLGGTAVRRQWCKWDLSPHQSRVLSMVLSFVSVHRHKGPVWLDRRASSFGSLYRSYLHDAIPYHAGLVNLKLSTTSTWANTCTKQLFRGLCVPFSPPCLLAALQQPATAAKHKVGEEYVWEHTDAMCVRMVVSTREGVLRWHVVPEWMA